MLIAKDPHLTAFKIRDYRPGEQLKINETIYHNTVLLTRDTIVTDFSAQQINEFDETAFAKLADYQKKLILIGTGETQHFPNPKLYANLLAENIAIEFMHTQAACHTYNILMSENRDVLVLLLV